MQLTARTVIFLLPVWLSAQNYGSPPGLSLGATDVYSGFRLPPLKDCPSGPLCGDVSSLQVAERAQTLQLTGQSPIDAWNAAAGTVNQLQQIARRLKSQAILFGGTTASALNRLLGDPTVTRVRLDVPSLTVDEPISIERDNLMLDLAAAQMIPSSSDPYMIRIASATNVVVEGGRFTSGNSAILVDSSSQVIVRNTRIESLSADGIVVTGSSQVLVDRNTIRGVSGAPIVIHRGTTSSVVQDNEIRDNLGPSNVTAGIVISDREVDLSVNPAALLGPDGYWVVSQPIVSRLNPPHDNVILSNRISNNLSSGIYSDGGVRNVVVYNLLAGNSKEGLCLDNGSAGNVVTGNTIQQNGQRWGESDAVMSADGIADGGRLPDGTPAEKVPGVSLDNAVYNIVFANQIAQNFGGGVKMVRTSYFNLIGLNTIFNNNQGEGPVFHFFGVELGATPGNPPSGDLDFTPSRGNIVFSNPTRGPHYSGIFIDYGSDLNDIFDNVIMDAENWALESVAVMQNNSLNNLTNIPSRNIAAGLDPSLLTLVIFSALQ